MSSYLSKRLHAYVPFPLSMANAGHAKLSLHPLWQRPIDLPVFYDHAGHGGGDKRLLSSIFGPLKGDEPEKEGASRMACTEVDGGE